VSLGAFNELYTKYKYMESSFERSKGIYKSKLPEIEQTLELVKVLKAKKDDDEEMITNFSLCDMVYSKAKVDAEAGIVGLWIGANIMVEYTHEEAIDLLTEQLSATKIKITELDEDLYFLRGNAITVEVNMARLFNHSVKLKKEAETKAGKA
jgi:prefoldin subunit 5